MLCADEVVQWLTRKVMHMCLLPIFGLNKLHQTSVFAYVGDIQCDMLHNTRQTLGATHWLQVRMLLPKRQLKPRTFRANADQTILIGGLARVDVLSIPGQSLYLTVWASDEVSCHYGRTDKAKERYAPLGRALPPPPRVIPSQRQLVFLAGNSLCDEQAVDAFLAENTLCDVKVDACNNVCLVMSKALVHTACFGDQLITVTHRVT